MTGIAIRPMEPEDRPAVIALFAEFIRHEAGLDPSRTPFVRDRTVDTGDAENYLHYCEHFIADGSGSMFVAVHGGEIVGLLCWTAGTDGPYVRPEHRRIGEIQFVVVSERHRGIGIGSLLLQKAEALTRDIGSNRLSLGVMAGNTSAVSFYERLGFETRAYKMVKSV